MEGSKRIILPLQQKTSKKQKRYHLMTESLLSNNTSNRFKFIMRPSLQKWNNNSTFTKTKDCKQNALVTCAE